MATTLTFAAEDAPHGSGPAGTDVSLDDGLTWQGLGSVTVDAPADHSNDGIHWVLARARDNAGNLSRARASAVRVDTEGPLTEAWGPKNAVRRGDVATVRFTLDDRSLRVFCQLVVTADATGKVVARRDLGWRSTWQWWWDWWGDWDGYTYRLTADLKPGSYTVAIAGATRDAAGNPWSSAVCSRPLVVK